MYNWFGFIDMYVHTANESWSATWEVNIHQFLAVITYAQAKLKRQEEYLKKHNAQ